MHFYRIFKLVAAGAGALFLAAFSTGCAVDAQDVCADDDPGCQPADQGTDESVDSADQAWGWGGAGFRGGLRPDLWGLRFRTGFGRGAGAFFVDRLGYRRGIPNAWTYGNLFPGGWGGWNGLPFYGGLGGIPAGYPIGSGAYLGGGGCGCGGGVAIVDDGCGCGGGVAIVDDCDPCDNNLALIDGGYRYGFRNRSIFNGYGFGYGGVRWGGLGGYPDGAWGW